MESPAPPLHVWFLTLIVLGLAALLLLIIILLVEDPWSSSLPSPQPAISVRAESLLPSPPLGNA